MGLSSNQARFLSLTSRQVDLEHRIQQICQRRLRLSSELEKVSTAYNNSISNRKMFTPSTAGIQALSISNLDALGYKIVDNETSLIIGESPLIKEVLSRTTLESGEMAITSASQLVTALNSNPNGSYVLMNDIDLSSLGTLSNSLVSGTFTGSLDGNGYTISNLNISENSAKSTGTSVHTGFFSNLDGGAIIKNLILEDCNVSSQDTLNPGHQDTSRVNSVGILAGFITSSSGGAIVDNVTVVNSTIATDHSAGGLIGIMQAGSVTNCSTSGNVNGTVFTGGLIGQIQGGNIDICNSSANVAGSSFVGGLVGESLPSGQPIVSRSYTTGNISGSVYIGGLMGRNHNAILQDCYTTGNISGSTIVGGICGDAYDSHSLINCYSSGSVSGSSTIAGLIGFAGGVGTVSNSFWLGGASVGYNGSASVTNIQSLSNYADLTTAAIAAGWGSNPNEFPETPLTGSGGSWNTSTIPPTLYTPEGYEWTPEKIEENLRNGRFSLIKEADEFTQDPLAIQGDEYEEIDWRSTPEIHDELYKADDIDAENKYDKAVEEINAQDKKLQIEQTSIEVEFKAISSERESVKKILDQNAQSSFKYFS